MWIVRLALRRPYTFVVAAMLVVILGLLMIFRTPTDIFPVVDIPVVSVAFNYSGMSPEDMNDRIVGQFERFLTTTVNDIEHIESQSLYGIGVIKIYFQKGAKIENATAQVTAVSQTAIRQMPPGTQPPLILQYNASSVPILQLSLSSDTLPEQAMFDLAVNTIRPKLITIPGVQIPFPFGGKQRQIMVDLEPEKLYAYGISASDVSDTINSQNLILPAGTVKIGAQENQVKLNSSPANVAALNNLPVKTVNNATVYVKDIAHVRDGFQVQTNVVNTNGKGGVLISIMKNGNASTLDVVDAIKAKLPDIRASVPPDLKVTPMFDQSVFVRASVTGVVKEAAIAAGLTAMMILLFLGSWRSTVIVMISIPLSILVSIIVLSFLGESLNVMTLGGMALAVGILVDDATVEIENIHRNLHQRKRLIQAILDGASQIAIPAFVSTLCICIVFVPVVFISGAAKYLFTPLAMAVVFAMMTSYLLSRTLVPTMVHYLLAAEVEMYGGVLDPSDPHAVHELHRRQALEHHQQIAPEDETGADHLRQFLAKPATRFALIAIVVVLTALIIAIAKTPLGEDFPAIHGLLLTIGTWFKANVRLVVEVGIGLIVLVAVLWFLAKHNLIWRTHHAFNRQFEKLRRGYGGLLQFALEHRPTVIVAFIILVIGSCALFPLIGTDFFPSVDAGQMRLHVRAPAGTRIEQTREYFGKVEAAIRRVVPAEELATVIDNIGIPNSSINLSLSDMSLISPADGEILLSLNPDHKPTEQYMKTLRQELPKQFPNLTFFFAPSDIVTQVLNFGLQAPIDVQVKGQLRHFAQNEAIAQKIHDEVSHIPGVVDVRMQQVTHTPDIRINVDRTLANQLNLSQRDVASDLLISLSSNLQTAPNWWLNPVNGVNYSILVQTPQYRMDTMNALDNTPIVPGGAAATPDGTQLLGNLATTSRGSSATNVTHYNIDPTVDVLLAVQGADLGSTANAVEKVVAKYRKELTAPSTITLRGQAESMRSSFTGLGLGLIFAVALVYLLMVINFQSWLDPMIILMALPGALAGILWMLFVTGTTISVPALMGAIMSIGVATANSILMITFANDQRKDHGMNAHDAALAAGLTRLRPVLMTALAMIIGMLPMSLGMGEGGEQNAPLGRAVIGGLSLATFATLFFVPVTYSLLRTKAPQTQVEEELR
jgi:multidrug efflux pump subunit AcrB